ncbi:DegT/DnrJ/EryC1/StrS aminotransferase family protein [Caldivirga sp.]|uniref:DegT/DnrJ/EryC1/StrS family aminotransferase n=1 Tax=Caldivirga sp. TaxID=2080243 RepID=UPI0025C22AC2|nr:DegT/DnrJ/EryC1/StrS family aminotransferase [Caldivirga sp.]
MVKWPPVNPDDEKSLLEAFKSGRWGRVPGGVVEEFEREFSRYHEAKYAVAVTSGTVGLFLSYLAVGLNEGDYFALPAYTFIATATAGVLLRAVPVFVDIDAETLNISVESLKAVLEQDKDGKIKLVVPVHFSGIPAELDEVINEARKHGAKVIEDAAQAHGAAYKGRKVGAIGEAGVFSFQSSKNMTAGEGGVIVTNDYEIYIKAWSYHNAGREINGEWYMHALIGWNFRMTELQAAILLSQLKRYDDEFKVRERNARLLYELLEGNEDFKPVKPPTYVSSSNHLLPIWISSRLIKQYGKARIVSEVNNRGGVVVEGYPMPLYRQPAFRESYWKLPDYSRLNLPVTEDACRRVIWVPQHVLLSEDETRRTAEALVRVSRELR